MASYIGSSLCFFFILSLSFSLQIQARDSKFFNKFSRQQTTKTTKLLDTLAPAPAPSSEPVVVERGYGLYGGENYRYPPMTVDPVKTGFGVGKEKRFVSMEELRNEQNGKQGMSDTRFLENGRYYYDIGQDVENGNGNGYETEKQGVREHVENGNRYPENRENGNGYGYGYGTEKQGTSDTRFLENGRYYYGVNRDVKDENRYEGDNEYVTEKQGMSHENVVDEPENQEEGNRKEYVTKQGMSDTRYLGNGKYNYDVNRDVVKDENTYKGNGNGNGYVSEKQGMGTYKGNGNGNGYVSEKQGMGTHDVDENMYPENQGNGNNNNDEYVTEKQGMSTHVVDENIYPEKQGNGNKNGYVTEKQGMSDTRLLENGRYYYDVNNEAKNGNIYPENTGLDNGNENGNKLVSNKQGMSDTKFSENGNGHSTENNNNENEYFQTQEENDKFDRSYKKEGFLNNKNGYGTGYDNKNEQYGGNNNGYTTHERRGEYMTEGSEEFNGDTRKLPPNQYDTMEEYEKEEEYRLSKQYQP